MSIEAQAKLLRILTDGELMRVGSTRARNVDVRVLVATNRNLEQRVRKGLFREDLFYRLAVVPIHLPPLRERREDIPGLTEIFCRQIAMELKMPRRHVAPEALQSLQQYRFPGNLRELKNLIERAYILDSNLEIGVADLRLKQSGALLAGDRNGNGAREPLPIPDPSEPFDLTDMLEKAERQMIVQTLASTGGIQAEAARRMGLSRSALAYKIGKYGISLDRMDE